MTAQKIAALGCIVARVGLRIGYGDSIATAFLSAALGRPGGWAKC